MLPDSEAEGVTIEDCVRVTHELDAPLETESNIAEIFKGAYELEVSSPGIDRPLRKPSDFQKFEGEVARVFTIRPLTGEETSDPVYSGKNPKQKTFMAFFAVSTMSRTRSALESSPKTERAESLEKRRNQNPKRRSGFPSPSWRRRILSGKSKDFDPKE